MSVRLQNPFSPASVRTGPIVLIAAILLGLMTSGLVGIWMKQQKPVAAKPIETRPVVVSLASVDPGQRLDVMNLKVVPWPAQYLPSGVTFSDVAPLAGRVVQSQILPGQPIYRIQLAGETSNGGLPVVIPEGMRAITVGITETKGVAGFIKPGDHVDILVTMNAPIQGRTDFHVTRTVKQDVLVLAMAKEMLAESQKPASKAMTDDIANKSTPGLGTSDASASSKPVAPATPAPVSTATPTVISSATLALRPEDIEKVVLAEETGSIRLALRPESDQTTPNLAGFDTQALSGRFFDAPTANKVSSSDYGGAATPPAPPLPGSGSARKRLKRGEIEVIEGTDKKTVSF